MCPGTPAGSHVTYIDLEFDAGANAPVLLGDIASSLVSLDDLLRDLGSIAAYPNSAEFRAIQIVGIEMQRPLKITLSLLEISDVAVLAFRDICRDVINFHEQRSRQPMKSADQRHELPVSQPASARSALARCAVHLGSGRITEQEAERIVGHITVLHNAEVHLKRIVVKDE